MSIAFLDPDKRLSGPARDELSRGLAALMNAEYHEAADIFAAHVKDDDAVARGFALMYLGDLYHFQWDFRMSGESYERAVAAFTEGGLERGVILTRMRLADIHVDQAASNPAVVAVPAAKQQAEQESQAMLTAAREDAEKLGDDFLIGFGLHLQALFHTEHEDFESAAIEAGRAVELRERIGDEMYGPSSAALLARAQAELGKVDEALALAEKTFELQMERKVRGAAMRTLHIIGRIRDLQQLQRESALTAQFTAVEPVARTPFIFGDRSAEELEVVAHSGSSDTPYEDASRNISRARSALVADPGLSVSMLQS
jgi:tetratricopeptide (TPR) repeat protein